MGINMTFSMKQDIEKIIGFLFEGLLTDGGHHKQHSIAQALTEILGKEQLIKIYAYYMEVEVDEIDEDDIDLFGIPG